jgi:hypothetical protein
VAATDQQVQTFVNERLRPFAEKARALYLLSKDHRAAIDDVYANVAAGSPTWTDNRTDGPPHLLVPNDVLAMNSFMAALNTFIEGNAEYAIILKACVHAPGV